MSLWYCVVLMKPAKMLCWPHAESAVECTSFSLFGRDQGPDFQKILGQT